MKNRVPIEAKIIGQNLRKVRKLQGLSQTAFGKKIGVSSQQIQKYESGQNRLSCDRMYTVCCLFNVPADWFFEGINSIRADKSQKPSFSPTSILLRLVEYPDKKFQRKIIKTLEILLS